MAAARGACSSMIDFLRQRRVAHARHLSSEPPVAALGPARDVAGKRVLVLGLADVELRFALGLTGVRLRQQASLESLVVPGSADVVLVPNCLASEVDGVALRAARALAGGGTVLVRLSRPDVALAREIRLTLVSAGFRDVRELPFRGGYLLRARYVVH